MKTSLSAVVLMLSLLTTAGLHAQSYVIPEATPAHIKRGVQALDRTEEQKARDMARKPAEVLTLASLEEGDHIAEISAFCQYYTTILSEAVGPTGKIDMYDMPYMEGFGAIDCGNKFVSAHGNANYTVVDYNKIELGSDLDAVHIVLYYHDLMPLEVDTAAFNARVFAALRPGGSYLVVDHKAEDGSGWRDAGTIHRIGKEVVVQEILAAGFELHVDSAVLSHPEDDRTQMVFSPGVRGGTDRMVLVFKKPD